MLRKSESEIDWIAACVIRNSSLVNSKYLEFVIEITFLMMFGILRS